MADQSEEIPESIKLQELKEQYLRLLADNAASRGEVFDREDAEELLDKKLEELTPKSPNADFVPSEEEQAANDKIGEQRLKDYLEKEIKKEEKTATELENSPEEKEMERLEDEYVAERVKLGVPEEQVRKELDDRWNQLFNDSIENGAFANYPKTRQEYIDLLKEEVADMKKVGKEEEKDITANGKDETTKPDDEKGETLTADGGKKIEVAGGGNLSLDDPDYARLSPNERLEYLLNLGEQGGLPKPSGVSLDENFVADGSDIVNNASGARVEPDSRSV